MTTFKYFILSGLLVLCLYPSGSSATAGPTSPRPVYTPSEMLPGHDDQERWKLVTMHLPNLIGPSENQIVKLFGRPGDWKAPSYWASR